METKLVLFYNKKARSLTKSTGFDSLPDHLVVEILYKLPLECVFRFFSVSKHWNSLNSDPCFGYNYCSSLKAQPQVMLLRTQMYVKGEKYELKDPPALNLLLQNKHKNKTGGCAFHGSSPYVSVLPFPHKLHLENLVPGGISDVEYMALASSNGLILCTSLTFDPDPYATCSHNTHYCWQEFYICNPITYQWIKLPQRRLMLLSRGHDNQVGFTTKLQGFSVVTSYRVVILHRKPKLPNLLEIDVFSSETNTWRFYVINPPRPLQKDISDAFWSRDNRCIATANGMIHCLENNEYNVLISYDPHSDMATTCSFISLPENKLTEKEKIYHKRVDEYNGILRYLEVFRLPGQKKTSVQIGIWTLPDCKHSSDWRLDQILTIHDSYKFHKRDYRIVGPMDSGLMYVLCRCARLRIYKKIAISQTMELADVCGKGKCDNKQAYRHTLSWLEECIPLTLPLWPTRITTNYSENTPLVL